MSAYEVRSIPALRVATITRAAGGYDSEQIAPVVGPMFPEVLAALGGAGLAPAGPAIAQYDDGDEGDVRIVAGFVVADGVDAVPGLDLHDLPALAEAAVLVHHGATDGIGDAWMRLATAIEEDGLSFAGPAREVYRTPAAAPQDTWVTELVQPISR